MLILEGAQAGLSWLTILRKREYYREAFHGFDPERIAGYGKRDMNRLLNNPGIVRNRLKIESAVKNARAFLSLVSERGSFSDYLWGFVGNRPIQNRWRTLEGMPPNTSESDAMSRDLKQRGFNFVGSTICYAFMQSTGMVNDHLVECFRYSDIQKLSRISEEPP